MPIELDSISEELLRAFVAKVAALDRAGVNSKTVASEMGLDMNDYIPAVERLIAAGCVMSNTGMLTNVVITTRGFAIVERMERD